ncbi:transposase [Rhodoferax aquaticus]|uniref:transposase n=1 Tax=Rhodoferax aquaticus TaxID=2527691 RepID=UPI001F371FB3|nr:transposase [Rhodoferax aquaticus]
MHQWCFVVGSDTPRFMVISPQQLPHMGADELRDVVQSLFKTPSFKQATIYKLTHEIAILKRLKFAAQSERFSAEQGCLLEDTLDEDLQADNDEIEQLSSSDALPRRPSSNPKARPYPRIRPRQHPPCA